MDPNRQDQENSVTTVPGVASSPTSVVAAKKKTAGKKREKTKEKKDKKQKQKKKTRDVQILCAASREVKSKLRHKYQQILASRISSVSPYNNGDGDDDYYEKGYGFKRGDHNRAAKHSSLPEEDETEQESNTTARSNLLLKAPRKLAAAAATVATATPKKLKRFQANLKAETEAAKADRIQHEPQPVSWLPIVGNAKTLHTTTTSDGDQETAQSPSSQLDEDNGKRQSTFFVEFDTVVEELMDELELVTPSIDRRLSVESYLIEEGDDEDDEEGSLSADEVDQSERGDDNFDCSLLDDDREEYEQFVSGQLDERRKRQSQIYRLRHHRSSLRRSMKEAVKKKVKDFDKSEFEAKLRTLHEASQRIRKKRARDLRKKRKEQKEAERAVRRANRKRRDQEYYQDSSSSSSSSSSSEGEGEVSEQEMDTIRERVEVNEASLNSMLAVLALMRTKRKLNELRLLRHKRILRKMRLIGILARKETQLRVISAAQPDTEQDCREITTKHRHGGTMTPVTAAFLQVLQSGRPTWGELIREMTSGLNSVDHPKVASSMPYNPESEIVFRPSYGGVRWAVLIGPSQQGGQMTKMQFFLRHQMEYPVENIELYLDPKKEDILMAFDKINARVRSGDCVFLYYLAQDGAKRGRRSTDENPDVLVPTDVETRGFGRGISEMTIFDFLIKPMAKGAVVTFLLDTLLHPNSFKLQYTLEQPRLVQLSPEQLKAKERLQKVATTMMTVNRATKSLKATINQHHETTNAFVQIISFPEAAPSVDNATGIVTSQFLEVMKMRTDKEMTIEFVLLMMRLIMNEMNLSQVPQMTCSVEISFKKELVLLPKGTEGRKRILLIGVDSLNEKRTRHLSSGSLLSWEDSDCDTVDETIHADWEPVPAQKNVYALKEFFKSSFDVSEKDCTILLDDGEHLAPARESILHAFSDMVQLSQPGDSVFVYFQGSGVLKQGQQCLVPCDVAVKGPITAQELRDYLILPIHKSVSLTCFWDMPLTASFGELPHKLQASRERMKYLIPARVCMVRTTRGGITAPFLSCMRNVHKHDKWIPAMAKMSEFVAASPNPNRHCILASSREITEDTEIEMVPSNQRRECWAILIGVNYNDSVCPELGHCHRDAEQFKQYLQLKHGLHPSQLKLLLDGPMHTQPTKRNIEAALDQVVQRVKPGDATFLFYSGHGTKVLEGMGSFVDGRGEKLKDGIVPCDVRKNGEDVILFNSILHNFVLRMPKKSHLTIVLDCFNSDSVMNLPYSYRPKRKVNPLAVPKTAVQEKSLGGSGQELGVASSPSLSTATSFQEKAQLSLGERWFGSTFANGGFKGLWSELDGEIEASQNNRNHNRNHNSRSNSSFSSATLSNRQSSSFWSHASSFGR